MLDVLGLIKVGVFTYFIAAFHSTQGYTTAGKGSSHGWKVGL
jgi:ABC-type transporter Mla maintaining outer membrane lipid asymmetry permease subunit MlaE